MTNETPIDDCPVAAELAALGAAIDSLNKVPADWELGMFEPTIHQVTLRFDRPVIWAKILMENLNGDDSCEGMDEHEKLFWAKVAFEMGPDWISKFRRVGAFMAAVDRA